MCPYEAAIVYVLLDEPDKAFSLLNKAVTFQPNCLIFTRNDPRLTPLRSDVRYLALLKTLALDDDAVAGY
jgi:hypothetical protein